MTMEPVTLKLPPETLRAVARLARECDVTAGQVVRDAIAAELRRAARNAKTPDRADEQLPVPASETRHWRVS